MNKLAEFEEIIGYKFNNVQLLKTALTHSSYSNENREKKIKYNERLEFLGDSVLSLIVSRYIFENYPKLPEGELTKIRASVVCEHSLWECASNIELGKFIILGHGEETAGGRTRMSILADAFEAIIAAIYLDASLETAREWVLCQLYNAIVRAVNGNYFIDYKTTLQEYIQARGKEKIEYAVIGESGPDHKKLFSVEVTLDGNVFGSGEGNSKKKAEQCAAQQALLNLKQRS